MLWKLLDATYKKNPTRVVLFARNKNREPKVFEIPYSPYFYIMKDRMKVAKRMQVKIEDTDTKGIKGEDLIKIVASHPKEIPHLRNKFREVGVITFEANVRFVERFLIDKGITTSFDDNLVPKSFQDYKYKVGFIDIEVYSETFPEEHNVPIISIAYKDEENSIVWCSKKVSLESHFEIRSFSEEIAMLKDFLQFFKENCPDILVSFSSFDIWYLLGRMDKKEIDISELSPLKMVSYRKETKEGRIYGVQYVDYRELYGKIFDPPFWTLDYIAKKELGYGKLECDVFKDWKDLPSKVVQYNIRDVEILYELEKKLHLIEYYLVPLRDLTGLSFMDCLSASKIGFNLHLRKAKEKGIAFWTYSHQPLRPYSGAYVFAETGLYKNVLQFDWKELYPSIMETFHISIDTKIPHYSEYPKVCLDSVCFRTDIPGITNEVMKEPRKIRKKYKELYSKTGDIKFYWLSFVYKQIVNSNYGLYGYRRVTKEGVVASFLYDPEIAEAITLLGKEVLKELIRYNTEKGRQVVYGDTDSVFVISDEDPENLRREMEEWIAKYLKHKYGVDSKLYLAFERKLDKLLVIAKKRYVAVLEDGTKIFKGLEIVRRDTSDYTTETLSHFVDLILEGKDFKELSEFISREEQRIRRKEIDIMRLAIRCKCQKKHYRTLTENYKALLTANANGISISSGERFYKLYIRPIRVDINNKGYFISNVIGIRDKDDLISLRNISLDYKKIASANLAPLRNLLRRLTAKSLIKCTLDMFM